MVAEVFTSIHQSSSPNYTQDAEAVGRTVDHHPFNLRHSDVVLWLDIYFCVFVTVAVFYCYTSVRSRLLAMIAP